MRVRGRCMIAKVFVLFCLKKNSHHHSSSRIIAHCRPSSPITPGENRPPQGRPLSPPGLRPPPDPRRLHRHLPPLVAAGASGGKVEGEVEGSRVEPELRSRAYSLLIAQRFAVVFFYMRKYVCFFVVLLVCCFRLHGIIPHTVFFTSKYYFNSEVNETNPHQMANATLMHGYIMSLRAIRQSANGTV